MHYKSYLMYIMDYMHISGTEPLSSIVSQTK